MYYHRINGFHNSKQIKLVLLTIRKKIPGTLSHHHLGLFEKNAILSSN